MGKPIVTDPDWWTVAEVAARWRCDDETIRRRIKDTSLPAMSGVGGYRIHRDEILAFEAKGRTKQRKLSAKATALTVASHIEDRISKYERAANTHAR